jgi:hypothetical protein
MQQLVFTRSEADATRCCDKKHIAGLYPATGPWAISMTLESPLTEIPGESFTQIIDTPGEDTYRVI